jgi:hypothetical protein
MHDLRFLRMMGSIEFDNQLRAMTNEIDDVWTERRLTTKVTPKFFE